MDRVTPDQARILLEDDSHIRFTQPVPLDPDEIHQLLAWACDVLKGSSLDLEPHERLAARFLCYGRETGPSSPTRGLLRAVAEQRKPYFDS